MSATTGAAQRGGRPAHGHVARNTAIFSIATGLSRIAGLVREIIAASFFGAYKQYSAFTIAFQVPNLVSNLFANAALSAAFVPVFTELLQEGRKREAFRLASTIFWIMLAALGALTAFFILAAHVVMPVFIGSSHNVPPGLTAGLAQVLFPVVLLLGLNGLLVGILQSYDRFSVAALSPLVWNAVIIVGVVVLRPDFIHSNYGIYAYAIAILIATVVQMLMAAAALQQIDFRLGFHVDWHDPRVKQVFVLMLPVTIGLGIVNLDQLINSVFGTLVSQEAPAAINYAFRIYMLPQGMFSVAVATVLFPTMSRQASRRDAAGMRRALAIGMRQINLLLIPAAAFLMVLATPVVRLIYGHGQFIHSGGLHPTSVALFWFAVSLPFGGINLLLTRTFFALKRPWIPTGLAAINIVVDIIVSVGLYRPLGVAGLVIGTAVANLVMTGLLLRRLRTGFNGRLEGRQTTMITTRIAVASALMAGVCYAVWWAIDHALGDSLGAQVISVGAAAGAGGLLYMRAVLLMRIPEARQVARLVLGRFGRA